MGIVFRGELRERAPSFGKNCRKQRKVPCGEPSRTISGQNVTSCGNRPGTRGAFHRTEAAAVAPIFGNYGNRVQREVARGRAEFREELSQAARSGMR